MNITIDTGCFNNMFGIPCDVIDHYINLASETQIKVLLVLMRFSGREMTSEQIAEFLNIDISEVDKSIEFWNNTNIGQRKMYLDPYDSESNSQLIKRKKVKISGEIVKKNFKDISENNQEQLNKSEDKSSYISPTALQSFINESKELEGALVTIKNILGRDLTYKEKQGIIYIYKDLHIELSAIVLIIKYYYDNKKYNMEYIKRVAEDWSSKGITSLEDVDNEIKNRNERSDFFNKIHREFKLNVPFAKSEIEYIDGWIEKKYSFDLIKTAYDNMLEKIHKIDFKYIDTTLNNWKKSGTVSTGRNSKYYNKNSSLKQYEDLLKDGVNE